MEKLKILVVDDESRMRKLVKDFLEREGYASPGGRRWDGSDGRFSYEEKDIALIDSGCHDAAYGWLADLP